MKPRADDFKGFIRRGSGNKHQIINRVTCRVALIRRFPGVTKALSRLSGPDGSDVTRLARGPYGEPYGPLFFRWNFRYLEVFIIGEKEEKSDQDRSCPGQVVIHPLWRRSPVPTYYLESRRTGLRGCQPFRLFLAGPNTSTQAIQKKK